MSATMAAAEPEGEKQSLTERILGGIEKVGNKVPHPVMIFIYLILIVIVLSVVLDLFNVNVTEEVIVPAEQTQLVPVYYGGSSEPIELPPSEDPDTEYVVQDMTVETQKVSVRSLLTVDGIRFIFTSFVDNFANFNVVSVIFVTMIGVGVAEEAGLMAALIRRLVQVAPARALTFIIVLIGGPSSVATDAGYLILIPLGAAAFLSVNRHPLAGIAAAFAGVSAAFSVNILIAPLDALLTEMTNEAIQMAKPGDTITITANLYFSIASAIVMAVIMTIITERLIEPRLGAYHPEGAPGGEVATGAPTAEAPPIDPVLEAKGLRYALYGLLAAIIVILLLTLPSGGPLREPGTGDIIGNTPFMDSLIFMITTIFLVVGICFGLGGKLSRAAPTLSTAWSRHLPACLVSFSCCWSSASSSPISITPTCLG